MFGGGGGFGATNPGQGAMMLELTKPPAAADRPVSALDCGKPVSLVHCCPFELTTTGEAIAPKSTLSDWHPCPNPSP